MLDRASELTIMACVAWVVTWAIHGQPTVTAFNGWFVSLVIIVIAALVCQHKQG